MVGKVENGEGSEGFIGELEVLERDVRQEKQGIIVGPQLYYRTLLFMF